MKKTGQLRQSFDKACADYLRKEADYLFEAVQAHCPVDTGNLVTHLEKVQVNKTLYKVQFRKDASMMAHSGGQTYAELLIKGTKPHMIERGDRFNNPKRRLAIKTDTLKSPPRMKAKGGYIFPPSVQHPGTKPNDFLEKALQETLRKD